jgi:hypothetical protein
MMTQLSRFERSVIYFKESSKVVQERLMSESAAPVPSGQELKLALKAFKKRLKLTRLDEESEIGRNPMSGGRKSEIFAIVPPNQYAQAVWDELVKQGKLKYAGHGTYELVES